jgi:hypothetical protein
MLGRQQSLLMTMVGLLGKFFSIICVFAEWAARQIYWAYSCCGDEVLAIVELGCMVAISCCVIKLVTWLVSCVSGENFIVKNEIQEAGNSYYVSRRVADGEVVHDVVVDGKVYCLTKLGENEVRVREEMALPGSELYPSMSRPVGCVLVCTDDTELTLVGCFFRVKNYLVTAKHVANAVFSGTADVYLAGCKEGRKGNFGVGKSHKVDREVFDIDSNAFKLEADVFVVELPDSKWSKMGVTAVSHKKRSRYGQTVSAVGFVNNLLMTSTGKTLLDSGPTEVRHTASTHRGFSGSPLFCGKSVVAMHVSGSIESNIAIRMEFILAGLPREESNDVNRERTYDDEKDYNGQSYTAHNVGRKKVHLMTSGEVDYYDEDEYYERYPSKKQAALPDLNDPTRWANYDDQGPWDIRNSSKGRYNVHYEDESAPVPSSAPSRAYLELQPRPAVRSNKTPQDGVEIKKYLDDHSEELGVLGYDATKYTYPEIDQRTEEVSLIKHLELYQERCDLVQAKPTRDEFMRAVNLVLTRMAENKFAPNPEYRSDANFEHIIDSSMVKGAKSPGRPYQADGMNTNEQVLKNYSKSGLIEIVKREWDKAIELKLFLKAEPHKIAKVDKTMARNIAGLPIHKLVKHQAIFREMLDVAVDNWKSSPVVYGFAPGNAGHIENLVKRFNGKTVVESDKSNWDYNYFAWLADMVTEIVVNLAIQPNEMSDEVYAEYLSDVRGSVKEVMYDAVYVTSSGRAFKPREPGIMKSGWLLTIFYNSVAQLLIDTLVLMRLGYSDEIILENVIVAGGDDVLQTLPRGIKTEDYISEAAKMGFVVTDIKTHKSFNGCEFFSNKFTCREGIWEFQPVRFTKHVAKLYKTKLADLPGTLCSHMGNYCWNTKKYNFFKKMYLDFRKDNPQDFKMSLLKTQRQLQYMCKGFESSE